MSGDMSYNEFQRELIKLEIEPRTARLLTMMYERMVDMSQQLSTISEITLGFANTLEGFVQLNEQQANRIKELERHGKVPGVEIKSEDFKQ